MTPNLDEPLGIRGADRVSACRPQGASGHGNANAHTPDKSSGVGSTRDTEAIVVGGGPAGSMIAAELAARGHDVVLLDKARFPRHKACSEYINAGGAALLDQCGVLGDVMALGAHRMEAMIVHAPSGSRFRADFDAAEAGRHAVGLSRYRLDALLLDRARAAGVDVREGTHVRDVVRDDIGRVTGVEATVGGTRETLRAGIVIGADGHHSVVSRALGQDVRYRLLDRTGFVAHYRGVQGLDRYGEMHIGHGFYAGFAPLEDGLTNVAVVTSAARAKATTPETLFTDALAALPEVAARMAGAERVGTIRGVGSMARRARHPSGDGWLLVGDAAAFLDPFTGEGIYEALKGATLAAPVVSAALRSGDVSSGPLAPYDAARRRTFTAKRGVGWIVQGFVNAPPLMNYITPRLAERDELGLTLAGVLGNIRPATQALSPWFLARLLRP